MAVTAVGTLGTGVSSTAGTSFTLTTATNALASGEYGLLTVVTDNIATADGNTNTHTSVTGGTGAWTKLGEYTNTVGGVAGDGVATSVWLFKASGSNAVGTVMTMNLSGSATDKSASFHKFTAGANLALLGGTTNPVTNGTDASNGFGSVAFSALPSREHLFFRGLGKEANSTTALTVSGSFTAITNTRSRNNAAAVGVWGEFIITTATGATSNPTLAVLGDTAGVYVVLVEQVANTFAAGVSGAATATGVLTTGIALSATDHATTVLAQSPAFYLRFLETSGTSAADSSGNGKTFTAGDAVTWGTTTLLPNPSEKAITVNTGTNQNQGVLRQSDTSIHANNAWTFQTLIKPTNFTAVGSLFGVEGSGAVFLGNAGNNELRYQDSNNGELSTGYTLSTGTTYHLTVVRSGSAAGSTVTFYINGTSISRLTLTSAAPTAGSTAYTYLFDNRNQAPFRGIAEEAAFWSSALTQGQIAGLAAYSGGLYGTGTSAGLLGSSVVALASAVTSTATVSGALTTDIWAAAAVSGTATAAGALTTGITLKAQDHAVTVLASSPTVYLRFAEPRPTGTWDSATWGDYAFDVDQLRDSSGNENHIPKGSGWSYTGSTYLPDPNENQLTNSTGTGVLSGTTNGLVLDNSTLPVGANAFSFATLVRPSSDGQPLLQFGTHPNATSVGVRGFGSPSPFNYYDTTNGYINTPSNYTFPGTYHLVVTRSSTGRLRIYVDGLKVVEQQLGSSAPTPGATALFSFFAGTSSNEVLIGTAEEAVFWQRELSEVEAVAIAQYGGGGFSRATTSATLTNYTSPAATFDAAITGTATVAGGLTTSIQCAASVNGSGVVAGSLTTAVQLAASPASSGTVTGSLTTTVLCAGSLSSTAVVAGALTTTIQCAASLIASATTTAALTTGIRLAATITGTATASAGFTGTAQLAATVTGSGSATGALTTQITCAAAATGTALTTGALTTAIRFAGALTGTGTTEGALTTTIRMAGAVTATGATSGALTTTLLCVGAVSGSAALQGALTTQIRFASAVTGSGAVSGSLVSSAVLLAASIAAAGTTTAGLTTGVRLTGAASATATIDGVLVTGVLFATSVTATATGVGYLQELIFFVGALTTDTVLVGLLTDDPAVGFIRAPVALTAGALQTPGGDAEAVLRDTHLTPSGTLY